MRRKDTDLLKVPESQYGSLTQDELLRLVVITRDKRSQRKKATKAWEMLIALDFDRVRGLVASFRFPGKGVRVHPNDIDDAVQYAFERLVKMLEVVQGHERGRVSRRDADLRPLCLHGPLLRRDGGREADRGQPRRGPQGLRGQVDRRQA